MPIFSDADFHKYRKIVKFKPLLKKPGPASQDLHIGNVYKVPKKRFHRSAAGLEKFLSMPTKQFVKEKCEKFKLKGSKKDRFWLIEPGVNYIAVAREKITLPEKFSLDVDTRSSWARLGLRVTHCDDTLDRHRKDYEGPILLNLVAQDKPILLRPNDRVCQAIVYDYKSMKSDQQIHSLLKSGDLKCYKQKGLPEGELVTDSWDIENFSLRLTLNKEIKRFMDYRIDPKKDVKQSYEIINISRGCRIGYGVFFLGSSNEVLYIGDKYVGILREVFSSPTQVRVHANAGYIDPGFEGTITLEQHIPPTGTIEDVIYPNMQMGEVEIHELMTKCKKPYKSKYSGQRGATVSMAHLDYKKKK